MTNLALKRVQLTQRLHLVTPLCLPTASHTMLTQLFTLFLISSTTEHLLKTIPAGDLQVPVCLGPSLLW